MRKTNKMTGKPPHTDLELRKASFGKFEKTRLTDLIFISVLMVGEEFTLKKFDMLDIGERPVFQSADWP